MSPASTALTLVIGNKNYSSWSLRPWLLLRAAGIPFEELRLCLDTPGFDAAVRRRSPAALVPVLHDGDLTVWDSLAICEYLAERFPAAGAWPDAPEARARARAVAAEMHAGFGAIRSAMPMNVRARGRRVPTSEALEREIARVLALWQACRERDGAGGPWLFGRFGIADCMYAPVATRFRTYGVDVPGAAGEWAAAILAHPAMQAWERDAVAEPETIPAGEVGQAGAGTASNE